MECLIQVVIVGDDTQGYTLGMRVEGSEGVIELQTGYVSPAQALEALVIGLTTAPPPPPDLTPYDEGLIKLSEIATTQEEIADAITTLGGRMNEVEDRLDGKGPVASAGSPRRSLLPGREVAAPPQTTTRPGPPPLRRPLMTKDRPDVEDELAARVHGQAFGGPSRRGRPIDE